MAGSAKEATVIIFDCGASTRMQCGDGTFFSIAKSCLSKIIQRKIFTCPADHVGIILMGTDATKNDLATQGEYENITKAMNLMPTTWEVLELIEKHLKIENVDADWSEALEVALDFLEKQSEGKKLRDYQIILISPLSAEHEPKRDVEELAEKLRCSDINLSVISHNLVSISEDSVAFSQTVDKTAAQKVHEEAIEKLINAVEGCFCTFNNALAQLNYITQKKTRAMPWNCDLTIGTKVKIPISAYVYTKQQTYLKAWKTVAEYTEEPARTTYKLFKGGEEFTPDDPSELINAYMYGSTVVPYDKELDVDFKTDGKCLKCWGFTLNKYVREKYFTGTGSYVVLPQRGSGVGEKMFTALVIAMRNQGVTMIARRVYNVRSRPKIMALVPTEKDNVNFLAMVELPFGDGIVDFHFDSFTDKKTEPSAEQYEAVDKLIDAMDLMTASDDGMEAFATRNTLNIAAQHTYRTLAARALYPTQPLPTLSEDLKEQVSVPPKIRQQAAAAAECVRNVFTLTPKPQTRKDKWIKKLFKPVADPEAEDEADDEVPSVLNVVDVDIVDVGTVTPAEDFVFLLHRGEKFSNIATQIQNVISSLVFNATTLQREKVFKGIFAFRQGAMHMDTAYSYNTWITHFKERLVERKKGDFWDDVIVKEALGLISVTEHSGSAVTEEEAKEFYKINLDAVTPMDVASTSGNVDDLFDDM